MVMLAQTAPRTGRTARAQQTTKGLVLLLGVVSILSLGSGATGVSLPDMLDGLTDREALILWDIRLPRLAMGRWSVRRWRFRAR